MGGAPFEGALILATVLPTLPITYVCAGFGAATISLSAAEIAARISAASSASRSASSLPERYALEGAEPGVEIADIAA